jgi:DNA-binding transcriptional regulator YdaS (Cro superfamily)
VREEELPGEAPRPESGQVGADPERLDGVDGTDDVKAAVIALIMEAMPQPPPPVVSAAGEQARLADVREELESMKPRALKRRALHTGVDPEKLDEADDAGDVKAAVIELIMEVEQQKQPDPVEARLTSLREELEALKPRALKKRALEVGVDRESLDEADDADDVKQTLIGMVLGRERERAEAAAAADAQAVAVARQVEVLRAELAPLKPSALKKRAAVSGVDPESVEEADDADDVKARLIELIVEQEERRLSGGAPSSPSSGEPHAAAPAGDDRAP